MTAISLAMHSYFAEGFLLGLPVLCWDSLRQARRDEREMNGTLWTTTGFAWTARSRARYMTGRCAGGNLGG